MRHYPPRPRRWLAPLNQPLNLIKHFCRERLRHTPVVEYPAIRLILAARDKYSGAKPILEMRG
ncbi:hypothetical protein MyNCGM683_32630 [Achromobacter xylosoxidans]